MTLDMILDDLSTITDFGMAYLTKTYVDFDDVKDLVDEDDVIEYVKDKFNYNEIYDDDDIESYVTEQGIGHWFSSYDVKDYIYDNFDVDDIVEFR